MNTEHKIWEMPDEEFLSFLYAERERDYAKYSSLGVNLWIAGAAIVGLLGYAFNRISTDYELFNWRLFTYYSITLGSIIITLASMISPIVHNRGWHSEYRVTTIAMNAPKDEMFWKGLILWSNLIWLYYLKDFGWVFWTTILLFSVDLWGILNVYIKGNKLIRVDQKGCYFASELIEIIYRSLEVLLGMCVLLVAIRTWGWEYAMAVEEFEMSCVLAIIVGVLWIIDYTIREEKYHMIDEVIDEYIYGNSTKQETYVYLLRHSQGFDIIDVIRSEYRDLKSYVKQIKPLREKHSKYFALLGESHPNIDKLNQYLQEAKHDQKVVEKVMHKVEKFNERLEEINQLETKSESIDVLREQLESMHDTMDELLDFSKECNEITRKLTNSIMLLNCK